MNQEQDSAGSPLADAQLRAPKALSPREVLAAIVTWTEERRKAIGVRLEPGFALLVEDARKALAEESRRQPQIGLRYVKETSFGRAPIATNMHDLVQEEARAKAAPAAPSAAEKQAKADQDLADQLLIEKAAARHIDKCNDRLREIAKQGNGFNPNSPAATLIFNDLLRAQLARMGAREQRNSRRRVELGQQKGENLARIKSLEKRKKQLEAGLLQQTAETGERARQVEELKAELHELKMRFAAERTAHMIALTSRPAAEKLAKGMLDQAISKVPVTDLPPITPAEEARKIAERALFAGKVLDPEARILSIETNHITEIKPVGLSGHEERVSTGRTEQRLKARCPCGVTFDLVRMTHPETKVECSCGAVYFVNASKGELTTMEPSPAAKPTPFSLFSKEEPGKPPTSYTFEGKCYSCGHSNRWIGQPAKTVLRCANCATSIGVDMNAGTITAAY